MTYETKSGARYVVRYFMGDYIIWEVTTPGVLFQVDEPELSELFPSRESAEAALEGIREHTLMEESRMKWPRGKYNGKRIGGFKIEFELNFAWIMPFHFSWTAWSHVLCVGPIIIRCDPTYGKD